VLPQSQFTRISDSSLTGVRTAFGAIRIFSPVYDYERQEAVGAADKFSLSGSKFVPDKAKA